MDIDKKRYNEILGWIINIYPSFDEATKRDAEYYFPELKESEDDKTKRLLHTIANKMGQHLRDIFTEEEFQCFDAWSNAWLEKRAEQKPAKNIVETWKDMRLEVYQQASGNRHEPNYSDDTTKMFSLSDIDEIIEKMSEQKPTAWSEEDKNHIETLLLWLRVSLGHEDKSLQDKINIEINWLKSLKERVQPQPKQEWSEEDENLLKLSVENLTELKDRFGKEYGRIGDCIDWLKSLRPHKQWKPSEEQMYNLSEAAHYRTPFWDCDILIGLYDDLKKLKEE